MFILYMDESGVEELHSPPAHFVLLGVMIPADSWKNIVTELEAVKEVYDLRDVEIHSAWMHRRYSEQDSIPGFAQSSRPERRTQVENEFRRKAGRANCTTVGLRIKIDLFSPWKIVMSEFGAARGQPRALSIGRCIPVARSFDMLQRSASVCTRSAHGAIFRAVGGLRERCADRVQSRRDAWQARSRRDPHHGRAYSREALWRRVRRPDTRFVPNADSGGCARGDQVRCRRPSTRCGLPNRRLSAISRGRKLRAPGSGRTSSGEL